MPIEQRVIIRNNRFPQLVRAFPQATSAIIGKTAHDLESTTKQSSAWVDRSGNLRNSHQSRFVRGAQEGQLNISTDYAGYLNYGTSRGIEARHWVEDGIAQVMPGFEASFRDLESRL